MFGLLVAAKWTGLICTSQVIGSEDCLWNDLLCVEWDVEPYYTLYFTA